MKILVVFYTRTNHTKSVGESIATEFGADVLQIKDAHRRTGVLNYFMLGKDAIFKRLARIQPVDKDAGDYDLIILGTPVWSFSLSSPMRAYIAEYSNSFKQVAYFCTEGGSGGERAFKQMSAMIGRQPVATMEITEADLKNGADTVKLAAFTDAIAHLTDDSALHEPELATS